MLSGLRGLFLRVDRSLRSLVPLVARRRSALLLLLIRLALLLLLICLVRAGRRPAIAVDATKWDANHFYSNISQSCLSVHGSFRTASATRSNKLGEFSRVTAIELR